MVQARWISIGLKECQIPVCLLIDSQGMVVLFEK
jgi:hypothetical protein